MNIGGIFRWVQGWVKIKGDTDGTKIGNISDALKVAISNSLPFYVNAIQFLHQKIHDGDLFSINRADTFALNNEIGFIFECDADSDVHITFDLQSSDDIEVGLYESPTYTGGSSANSLVYNRNRNSSNTFDVNIKYLVTVTDNGTQLEGFLGGATGGAKTANTGARQEWVLKRGLNYLLRFKSLSPGNEITTNILFYESAY
jgi:hypothetical protein